MIWSLFANRREDQSQIECNCRSLKIISDMISKAREDGKPRLEPYLSVYRIKQHLNFIKEKLALLPVLANAAMVAMVTMVTMVTMAAIAAMAAMDAKGWPWMAMDSK